MTMTQRICIAGGPRTGKTVLSAALGKIHGYPVHHTDVLLETHPDWSDCSAEVARWFNVREPPWIVEGVPVARALRKWLGTHATGRPCDLLFSLSVPRVTQSEGQRRMGVGCETVLAGIRQALVGRGVVIRYGAGDLSLPVVS